MKHKEKVKIISGFFEWCEWILDDKVEDTYWVNIEWRLRWIEWIHIRSYRK